MEEKTFDQEYLQRTHLGITVDEVNEVTFTRIDFDFFANVKDSKVADTCKLKFWHSVPELGRYGMITRKNKSGEYITKPSNNQTPHMLVSKLQSHPRALDYIKQVIRVNGYKKDNPAYVNAVKMYKVLLQKKKDGEVADNSVITISIPKTTNAQATLPGENNKTLENMCLVTIQDDQEIYCELFVGELQFGGVCPCYAEIKKNVVANAKYRLDVDASGDDEYDELNEEW
ncbi:hypothetical protein RI537_12390 [Aeromonas salmonicida]|uniref:hypothetical protein n=1 Tax=Aeromonas salmonicida TaxID=645 RepID=UPI00344A4CD7